ncbi:MAG: enhanced intracellular survival protein Eis [Aristaeellaceae bacterium]
MIIRRIRENEYRRCQEFCALAFEYAMKGADKSPEEALAEVRANPTCRQDQHWDSQWAAFAGDDATMLSTMTVIPYRATFDGAEVLMEGIGGVSTLPQYRRMGGIRGCFEHALPAMEAEGAALSYLYPFSSAFYRKFGYETACAANRWKLALRGVPKETVPGSWALLEKGSGLGEAIRRIDRGWQERYNCMVRGEDIEYRWVEKANPFADRVYTYVYMDASGEPSAYMTCRPVVDEGDKALECTRFVFADVAGFRGLMALLKTLEADHSHVILTLPEDVPLDGLLPEWSLGCVQCRKLRRGMARVVSVRRVLEIARMRGEGRLVLDIRDGQIPCNNGRFAVAFAPGEANRVFLTEEEPDVSLSIQDFTRLILGCHDVEELRWLPEVRLHCAPEKAAQVFYRKPMYITQDF